MLRWRPGNRRDLPLSYLPVGVFDLAPQSPFRRTSRATGINPALSGLEAVSELRQMNHALTYIGAEVSGKPAEAVRAAQAEGMIEGLAPAHRTTTHNEQAQMNRCACTT